MSFMSCKGNAEKVDTSDLDFLINKAFVADIYGED